MKDIKFDCQLPSSLASEIRTSISFDRSGTGVVIDSEPCARSLSVFTLTVLLSTKPLIRLHIEYKSAFFLNYK